MDFLKHEKTVIKVARHYAGLGLDIRDLEQEGWLAILKNYKPGHRAWLCIKREVVRALHAQHIVRLPEYLITRDTKINRGETEGLNPLQIARAQEALNNRRAKSLDDRHDGVNLHNIIGDIREPYDPTPDLACKLIATLDDRERYVIERNFGLNGYEKTSLETIGAGLNIRKSMAGKIKQGALKKLRAKLEEKA
jgi:RNA polymerase nonessential primary-like sigma factor